MTIIDEGSIRLEFSADWTTCKWDDSAFRKRRGQHGKALDIVAFDASQDTGAVLAIEVKDYPDHPKAKIPEPDELASICSTKVRDTLAQMIFGPSLEAIGRPVEDSLDEICIAFGSTTRPLTFVLLVEDANEPPIELVELQVELERAFRWLPSRVITAATIEDLNRSLRGLTAGRI